MAAFRKLFLAVAAVAAMTAVTASAQSISPITPTCYVSTNAPYIRYQGLAEQIGDIVITCQGGTPTAAGLPVPVENFSFTISNLNITSKLTGGGPSTITGASYDEAILAIDEPVPNGTAYPSNATPYPGAPVQSFCDPSDVGACVDYASGVGGGIGVPGQTYDPTNDLNPYNVFQGYQLASAAEQHTVHFDGIPIDPPGTNHSLVIRITNIRVNANPYSTPLTPVKMNFSATGTQTLTFVNNTADYIVAYSNNAIIPGTFNGTPSSICSGPGSITVSGFQEGFASSFKARGYTGFDYGDTGYSPLVDQNVFGYPYFTESGFYESGIGGNYTNVGTATNGTRILFSLTNIQNGLRLRAPDTLYMSGGTQHAGLPSGDSGKLVLVGTDANGVGYTSPSDTFTSAADGSSVIFVYEVVDDDPGAIETINDFTIWVDVTGAPVVTAPTTYIMAQGELAPIDTTPVASATASIPRFIPGLSPTPAANTFYQSSCQCDLLFPYVVSGSGLETGIAISNTSLDPYGTTPQNGFVQLFYYPNFSSTYVPPTGWTFPSVATPTAQDPFTQTTAVPIAAGDQLLLVLGGGSANPGANIAGVPGFTGYMIASTGFQYCHGYAFVTDTAVQKLAQGYLALVLDGSSSSSFRFSRRGGDLTRDGGLGPVAPNLIEPEDVQAEKLDQ